MQLEIKLHSIDEIDIVEVEDYNPVEVANIINGVTQNEHGNPQNVLVLGDNIYSCVDIKGIKIHLRTEG